MLSLTSLQHEKKFFSSGHRSSICYFLLGLKSRIIHSNRAFQYPSSARSGRLSAPCASPHSQHDFTRRNRPRRQHSAAPPAPDRPAQPSPTRRASRADAGRARKTVAGQEGTASGPRASGFLSPGRQRAARVVARRLRARARPTGSDR